MKKEEEQNNKKNPMGEDNFQTPISTRRNTALHQILGLPRRGSSGAVSGPNRRNTSPALSSCVATTVTIILAAPVTYAVSSL